MSESKLKYIIIINIKKEGGQPYEKASFSMYMLCILRIFGTAATPGRIIAGDYDTRMGFNR
jgi:hypothetical protein